MRNRDMDEAAKRFTEKEPELAAIMTKLAHASHGDSNDACVADHALRTLYDVMASIGAHVRSHAAMGIILGGADPDRQIAEARAHTKLFAEYLTMGVAIWLVSMRTDSNYSGVAEAYGELEIFIDRIKGKLK